MPDWINSAGEETDAPSEAPSCMNLADEDGSKKPSAKSKPKAKAKAASKAASKAKAKAKAKAKDKTKSTKEKKPRKKSPKTQDAEDAEDAEDDMDLDGIFGDDDDNEEDDDQEEQQAVKTKKKAEKDNAKSQGKKREKAWPMLAQILFSCMPNVQCSVSLPSSFSQVSAKTAAQKLRKLAEGGS